MNRKKRRKNTHNYNYNDYELSTSINWDNLYNGDYSYDEEEDLYFDSVEHVEKCDCSNDATKNDCENSENWEDEEDYYGEDSIYTKEEITFQDFVNIYEVDSHPRQATIQEAIFQSDLDNKDKAISFAHKLYRSADIVLKGDNSIYLQGLASMKELETKLNEAIEVIECFLCQNNIYDEDFKNLTKFNKDSYVKDQLTYLHRPKDLKIEDKKMAKNYLHFHLNGTKIENPEVMFMVIPAFIAGVTIATGVLNLPLAIYLLVTFTFSGLAMWNKKSMGINKLKKAIIKRKKDLAYVQDNVQKEETITTQHPQEEKESDENSIIESGGVDENDEELREILETFEKARNKNKNTDNNMDN